MNFMMSPVVKRKKQSTMSLRVQQSSGCCLCGCGQGVNSAKCWFMLATN